MTKEEKRIKINKMVKILKEINHPPEYFIQKWGLSKSTAYRYYAIAKKRVEKSGKIGKIPKKKKLNSQKIPKKKEIIEKVPAESKILKQKRVQEFVKFLSFGNTKRAEFIRYAKNMGWDVCDMTVDRYLKEAKDLFYESFVFDSRENMKKHTSNMMLEAMKRSLAKGDNKTALSAAQAINKAFGLDMVQIIKEDDKVDEVDKSDEIRKDLLRKIKEKRDKKGEE